MLNGLWAGMLLVGIAYGAISGNMEAVGEALVNGGGKAIEVCITMLGVLGMWCGMLEIAEKSGVLRQLEALQRPFLHFLFPRIPKEHPALTEISVNFAANLLGLGWAATPAGLRAMEQLKLLQEEQESMQGNVSGENSRAASNEMCAFLVLNISSLQLLPVSMIAYRSQYGSAAPAAIVGPAIAATAASTAAAVIICRILGRK